MAHSLPVDGEGSEPVYVRDAEPGDADFLTAMLLEAFNWTGERRFGRAEVMADPEVAHYVAGWPRPGDIGVVAVGDDAGPIGAAWARTFGDDDPGYGFVDAATPELSIAVRPGYRGAGVGRALLAALLDRARSAGYRRLSLSVEDGNPARHLYTSLGFAPAGRRGDSDTLVADLG